MLTVRVPGEALASPRGPRTNSARALGACRAIRHSIESFTAQAQRFRPCAGSLQGRGIYSRPSATLHGFGAGIG